MVLTRQGYKMPTIPQRAEYANETYFVTNPAYQDLIFRNQGTDILALAMFTDGIQNLAIDLSNKRPNDACISRALATLDSPEPNQALSEWIAAPDVALNAQDDATIIIARQEQHA